MVEGGFLNAGLRGASSGLNLPLANHPQPTCVRFVVMNILSFPNSLSHFLSVGWNKHFVLFLAIEVFNVSLNPLLNLFARLLKGCVELSIVNPVFSGMILGLLVVCVNAVEGRHFGCVFGFVGAYKFIFAGFNFFGRQVSVGLNLLHTE